MGDENVRTGVDDLLELLRSVEKIALIDAAKKLQISTDILQSWVDFLVEEEIIGVEYKFTKPIIYLNRPPEAKIVQVKEEIFGLEAYKEDFKIRAVQRNIPIDKVDFFWANHVKEALNNNKELFFREARKRNLRDIDLLWNKYANALLSR